AAVIALVFSLVVSGPVRAQNATATGANITWYGTFTVKKTTEIKDRSISTGTRFDETLDQPQANSDRIVLRDGLRFGFGFTLSGRPATGIARIRYVYKYPAPGIDRGGDKPQLSDEVPGNFKINRKDLYIGWTVGSLQGLPEGVWTFQVYAADRLLAEKSFSVSLP